MKGKAPTGPKRGAVVLMVLGALTAGAGVIGLATTNGGGSTSGAQSPSPHLSASVSAPASGSPSPVAPSLSPAAETVEQFLPLLATAFQTAQADVLLARLHPAVIALYGQDQCQAYTAKLKDATRAFEILSVSTPGTWNYNPDGRSIPVSDVYTVRVRQTLYGKTTTADIHLGLVDGEIRWFTDCGTPQS